MNNKKEYKELAYLVLRNAKRKKTAFLLSDLSPAEFSLIDTIVTYKKTHDKRDITVNEIAQDMEISAPAVSKSLKSLENRGIISRVTSESSRRNTFVHITESGIEIYEKNMEVMGRLVDKILSSFTEKEIEQMIAVSKKINMILDEETENLM